MTIGHIAGTALCAALLAACSSTSGGGAASPSSSGGPQTYTDPAFGFSFTYDEPFEWAPNSGSMYTMGNSPVGRVTVAEAADQPGVPVTAFSVTTFDTGAEAPEPSEAKQVLSQHVLDQFAFLKKQAGNGAAAVTFSPLKQTTVADTPALSTDGSFSVKGDNWTQRSYFVLAGTNEYQVAIQAPASDWKTLEPTFQKMLESFSLPSETPDATPTPFVAEGFTYSGENAEFCNSATDLIAGLNTASMGESTGNDLAISRGKESSISAVQGMLASLPKGYPAKDKATLDELLKELQTASASPSAHPSPSPSASGGPQSAMAAVSDLAQEYCGG